MPAGAGPGAPFEFGVVGANVAEPAGQVSHSAEGAAGRRVSLQAEALPASTSDIRARNNPALYLKFDIAGYEQAEELNSGE
jgi:hypothetical protein